jgi:sugar lactone lactonase YvrE
MIKNICCVLFFLLMAAQAPAQGTRQWKVSSYEDFERGTARSVAISSTGVLELAPAFKLLYTSPATFIWSMAADSEGVVYAATGSPARVYRITPDGKDQVIFEAQELQVQAVTIAKDGAVYAATSPDGKVYKITRSASAEYSSVTFFDPKTKYIWDMALDAEGRLYVATGDRGEIYRVEKNGQGSVFFKSDEGHIRVMEFDGHGNLIAGSDGSGLIYRIAPGGEGFVLYSAPKKEITALAIDSAGAIYAAGTGDKHPSPTGTPGFTSAPAMPTPAIPPPGNIAQPNVSLAGSDLYAIAPDGAPRKLWSSREDIIYALNFDASGRLIAGTGNKGRILAIERNGAFTDLLKAPASQVTACSKAPKAGLYCSSSNLGKIFLMGGAPEAEGTFESEVQDAHVFSKWGRAEVRGRGSFELFARSGNVENPDRNWSPWAKVDLHQEARLSIPAARYVQWRGVMKPASPSTQIYEVTINYLSRNVAPVIEDLVVQVGARFQPQIRGQASETIVIGASSNQAPLPRIDPQPTALRDRSYVAARWTVHDDNDDELVYALYYRGDNEQEWKLLKAGLMDKFYSFDSGLLPDGGYTLKVVASDAPSHTADQGLSDEKESVHFEIDNTAPVIQKLAARMEGVQLHVTFEATDSFSAIRKAEYSIDAGDWQFVEPVGQLSDSKIESYDFYASIASIAATPPALADQGMAKRDKTSKTPNSEHIVVVRVYDRYDNAATAKYVAR